MAGINTAVVQQENKYCYVIRGVRVCIESIDAACAGLYLDHRFNPERLILSQPDADALLHTLMEKRGYSGEFPCRLGDYINNTTGTYMHTMISQELPEGTFKLWGKPQEQGE